MSEQENIEQKYSRVSSWLIGNLAVNRRTLINTKVDTKGGLMEVKNMKKLAKKAAVIMLTSLLAISLTAGLSIAAAKKLVIEDGTASEVFSVSDDGSMSVTGQDVNNAFSYKIIGHTGGSAHTQTATGLADSRLTVMAAETDDYAPRLAMSGPQDVQAGIQGWMVFDYGSEKYDLPNARFVLRHYGTGGINDNAIMLQAVGRQSVSFPTGNVGIGTTSPTHLIQLAGGAYSDGATWVNASSRELKKDIMEVSTEEALKTVESLKPVTYVYKKGNQDTHVGFIAEDVPEMVATPDRKGIESMDIAAVLTKVVQEQQRMLKDQQATMQQLQDKIVSLENAMQLKKDKDMNVAQLSDGISLLGN